MASHSRSFLPALLLALGAAGCRSAPPPGGQPATTGGGVVDGAPAEPGPGGGSPPAPTDPWLDDARVLARVNGRVVSLREMRHLLGPSYDAYLDRRDELAKIVDSKLRDLVVTRLLEEEARRIGLTVPQDLFDRFTAAKEEEAARARTTLDQAIRDMGMTRREWDGMNRRQLLVQRFVYLALGEFRDVPPEMYRVAVDTFVTPEEILAYGARHPEETRVEEQATVRLLDLRWTEFARKERLSDEDAWAACARAMDAVEERLRAGEEFGKVVQAVSHGEAAANGGLLEPFGRASPRKREIVEWAFSEGARPGDVSRRIRLPSGYVLLRLEARVPAHDAPVEEWGPRVRARLEAARRDVGYAEIVLRLLEESSIQPQELRAGLLGEFRAQRKKGLDARP